ncbi:hypothetical protein MAPG_09214 [Magnaporthiopsis poae ATCC 64411]|uniref:Secreted protein n=1 Tax=Magnaporthiopsis poae (strain ATCC 64411 / 73-15) TaxID=644358 RepID=A0A0C4E9D3_MAGP6|nr:hypothetical protein MAPG_09214 [Magnaporthiopsis poae ATCC 64411]
MTAPGLFFFFLPLFARQPPSWPAYLNVKEKQAESKQHKKWDNHGLSAQSASPQAPCNPALRQIREKGREGGNGRLTKRQKFRRFCSGPRRETIWVYFPSVGGPTQAVCVSVVHQVDRRMFGRWYVFFFFFFFFCVLLTRNP